MNIDYCPLINTIIAHKVSQSSKTSGDQRKLLDTEDAIELGEKLDSGEFETVTEDQ